MANLLQSIYVAHKKRPHNLNRTMMFIKSSRPRASILPLVVLVVALFLIVRFSSFTLHRVEEPIEHAETDRSRIPRVFEDEKRNDDLPKNEQLFIDEAKEEEMAKPNSRQMRFCDKQSETDNGFCIFDIGLNNGQDTVQYLDFSPEARVVAVEANPTLVNRAKERFDDAISESRLKILNIGLVGNETDDGEESPKLEFWINKANDVFSSFKQRTGCRDAMGKFLEEGDTTFCRKIEMETKSCSELINEYGPPRYMKIDIEGKDRECLQSLGKVREENRPKYASIENVNKKDIDIFTWLGYRQFKVVNQNKLQMNLTSKDMEGHSGPWGEDADDYWIGKKWHTGDELLNRLPLPASIMLGGRKLKGWYDLHAKM